MQAPQNSNCLSSMCNQLFFCVMWLKRLSFHFCKPLEHFQNSQELFAESCSCANSAMKLNLIKINWIIMLFLFNVRASKGKWMTVSNEGTTSIQKHEYVKCFFFFGNSYVNKLSFGIWVHSQQCPTAISRGTKRSCIRTQFTYNVSAGQRWSLVPGATSAAHGRAASCKSLRNGPLILLKASSIPTSRFPQYLNDRVGLYHVSQCCTLLWECKAEKGLYKIFKEL